MAVTDSTGPGIVQLAAKKAVESVMVAAAVRAMTLIGIPICIGILTWGANNLLELREKMGQVPATIALLQANIDGQIKGSLMSLTQADARMEGRIDSVNLRIDAALERLRRLEQYFDKHEGKL